MRAPADNMQRLQKETQLPAPDVVRRYPSFAFAIGPRNIFLFLLLVFAGCDPAYVYYPVNDAGDLIERDHRQKNGASISCSGFSELIGSRTLVQAFEVSNETSSPVVLQEATLGLDTKTIRGQTPSDGDLQWRSVLPGTTGQILVYFDLSDAGGTVKDALGRKIKYKCDFEIDGKSEKLEWNLSRSERVPKTK